jgi:radical SAM protein with 4Fe4S-binding SPASM domain
VRALRGLVSRLPPRYPAFLYEITPRCNLDCRYCYNVWKRPGAESPAELETTAALEVLDRVLRATRARSVTVTGGEPLLRADLEEVVAFLAARRARVTVITNGTLLDRDRTRSLLDAGTSLFEIPLLSHRREVHDRLVRGRAFSRALDAIANVRVEGGIVVGVIVLTRENASDVEPTLELLAAAGVDAVMLNRVNPGGEGLRHVAELTPSADQLAAAFSVADRIAGEHGLPIASSVPVPPCTLETTPFANLTFGTCPVGTRDAYFTVDPTGNVRPCNHSPTVLGSLFEENFRALAAKVSPELPSNCVDCDNLESCRGGCPAAGIQMERTRTGCARSSPS